MNLQSAFAETFVDEWARAGVAHGVVCPGSRSTPLAVALLRDPRIVVDVRLDERSAGFFAVGAALGSGRPAVIVTTSGTAAAELHAAVLEADLGRVPLIVCTADRPFELHRVGAPQTVEQVGLYGGAVRFALDLGVPEEQGRAAWRSVASRLVAEAVSSAYGPGPVHLNVAFREPLVCEPASAESSSVPPGRLDGGPWHETIGARQPIVQGVERLSALLARSKRGVIVAGAASTRGDPAGIYALAEVLGWPVLAEPRAFRREPHDALVTHGDAIARSDCSGRALRPDLVLRLGSPHASRALSSWIERIVGEGSLDVLIERDGRFEDPARQVSLLVSGDPAAFCAAVAVRLSSSGVKPADGGEYLSSWRRAEAAVEDAIDATLSGSAGATEPGTARELMSALPSGATLVVSSSMPVRDLEWFAGARAGAPLVLSNRGANGIDGVVSTVLGVARAAGPRSAAQAPVVGLLGDLAFFHDLSGLVRGEHEEPVPACLVVIDNKGGGIFSFLDQADKLDGALFERGFATPQAPSIAEVARALGCEVFDGTEDFEASLRAALAVRRTSVVVRTTERRDNVALHRCLVDAAVAAVEDAV